MGVPFHFSTLSCMGLSPKPKTDEFFDGTPPSSLATEDLGCGTLKFRYRVPLIRNFTHTHPLGGHGSEESCILVVPLAPKLFVGCTSVATTTSGQP